MVRAPLLICHVPKLYCRFQPVGVGMLVSRFAGIFRFVFRRCRDMMIENVFFPLLCFSERYEKGTKTGVDYGNDEVMYLCYN